MSGNTEVLTKLLENAIESDNDAERLSYLNQAKRFYNRNTGVVMPRRVQKQTVNVVVAGDRSITLREHHGIMEQLEKVKNSLMRDNERLGSENTALRTQLMAAGQHADEEVIDMANKQIRNARAVSVAILVMAVAAFSFIAMI